MMRFLIGLVVLYSLSLGACRMKGTDSGNPGEQLASGAICDENTPQSCATVNPAIALVDRGLCATYERCGSDWRGVNCRDRVLATTVLPEVYGRPEWADSRSFAVAAYERKITADASALNDCLQDLAQVACPSIDANASLADASRNLLLSQTRCLDVFKP